MEREATNYKSKSNTHPWSSDSHLSPPSEMQVCVHQTAARPCPRRWVQVLGRYNPFRASLYTFISRRKLIKWLRGWERGVNRMGHCRLGEAAPGYGSGPKDATGDAMWVPDTVLDLSRSGCRESKRQREDVP